MNCKNCNAVMRVDEKKKLFVCPYCDSTEPFDNMTQAEVTALVQDAISGVRDENRQMIQDMAVAQQKEMARDKAGKTIAAVVAIVFLTIASLVVLIMMIFGFDTEYKASGVIACIQLVLLIAAIVLKSVYLSRRSKKTALTSNVCIGVAAFLVPAWFISLAFPSPTSGGSYGSGSDYEWPTTGYAAIVPQYGEKPDVAFVGSKSVDVHFTVESVSDFAEYVQMCKDAGFTIDSVEKDISYLAYNEQDYKLYTYYMDHSKKVYVTLNTPIVMGEFYWLGTGMSQKIPKPEAESCYVESFSSNDLKIYVGDLTETEFLEYLEACMDAGFDGKYHKDTETFYGEKDGIRLTIQFMRNRIMYISIYEY